MQRHREIAGSPQRTAGATWTTISDLIVATLERSNDVSGDVVRDALNRVAGVGRGLVAAGHLASNPIVVVGDDFWLEILVVAGDASLSLQENLNYVPGGASVKTWRVHLPAVGGMAKAVTDAASQDEHLSTDPPTPIASESTAARTPINLAALAAWGDERE